MEYVANRRINQVFLLSTSDVVQAVYNMSSRAKQAGFGMLFFPEAGGIPYKYICKILHESDTTKIISTKVTALSKAPLSKQICGLLSKKECSAKLTAIQLAELQSCVHALSIEMRKKLSLFLDLSHLHEYSIGEIVQRICSLGLFIPSEDPESLVRDGVWPTNNFDPESNGDYFDEYRKKIIVYSAQHIQNIKHETRPLLNIILSRTVFARQLQHCGSVYVIDEAIGRGRTLNTLEILFKSFFANIIWKIGLLYSPVAVDGFGPVDYIASTEFVPIFSNRCDLIGEIVVESEHGFAHYDIKQLLAEKKHIRSEVNHSELLVYNKKALEITRAIFFELLNKGIVTERDIVRLAHFVFTCTNREIIKSAIDLHLMDTTNLIEEVDYFINQPHPFSNMEYRKAYKAAIQQVLHRFMSEPDKFVEWHACFDAVKELYEIDRLSLWYEQYIATKHQIDFSLQKILSSAYDQHRAA